MTSTTTDWSDPAAWYDLLNPWGPSDDFHLARLRDAERVLDVGCGTGMLLHRARREGHRGRLVGLEPDETMLARARALSPGGIEWVRGTAEEAPGRSSSTMPTWRATPSSAWPPTPSCTPPRCDPPGARARGTFAFETRHPQARAWEDWNGTEKVVNPDGGTAVATQEVTAVDGDVVTLTETFTGPWWPEPLLQQAQLRFLAPGPLNAFLARAGFTVVEQYGDWRRGPLTAASRVIVTVAQKG
ncbi:class I SAM-dependent methyltransferase [Streptacidiphilus monticola]